MKGHVKTGYVGNGGWCIPLPFIDYRRLFLLPQRWSPTRVHQGRNVSASLITSRADIGDNRTDSRPTEPPRLCNHYLSVGLRFLLPFISGNLIAARENSKRKHHLCIPQVINTHFYEKSFRFSRCGIYTTRESQPSRRLRPWPKHSKNLPWPKSTSTTLGTNLSEFIAGEMFVSILTRFL